MKAIPAAVLVLALSCGWLFAARQPPRVRRDLKARVSAILERFPAETPAKKDALCAEILRLGPGAVADVCARVLPPGKGDDSRARFAVNGLAVHVMRPGAESRAGPLRPGPPRLPRQDAGQERRRVLPLAGPARREAGVRSGPSRSTSSTRRWPGRPTAALLAIGGPSSTQAMLKALDKAPRSARLTLLQSLGEARSREAVKKILPFADSADEGLRQAALFALANIGDPAAGPVLSRSRVAASYRERVGRALALSPLRPAPGRVRPDGRGAGGGPRGPRELPSGRGVAARVRGPRPRRLDRRSAGPARPSRGRGQPRPGLPRLGPHPGREDPGERGDPPLGREGRHGVARRPRRHRRHARPARGRGGPAVRPGEPPQLRRGRAPRGHPRRGPPRRPGRPPRPAAAARLGRRRRERGAEDGARRLPRRARRAGGRAAPRLDASPGEGRPDRGAGREGGARRDRARLPPGRRRRPRHPRRLARAPWPTSPGTPTSRASSRCWRRPPRATTSSACGKRSRRRSSGTRIPSGERTASSTS